MFEEVAKQINWLFENKPYDISWSEVQRQTGVDRRTIGAYRNGIYDLKNINLKNGLLLYDYSLRLQSELSCRRYLSEIPNSEFITQFDELKRVLKYDKYGAYFKTHRDFDYWLKRCQEIVASFEL